MEINFTNSGSQEPIAVFFAAKGGKIPADLEMVNKAENITNYIKLRKSFKYEAKDVLQISTINCPEVGLILLLGLGEAEKITELTLHNVGAKITDELNALKAENARVIVNAIEGCSFTAAQIAAHLAFGASLKHYTFTKYFKSKKEKNAISAKKLDICLEDATKAKDLFKDMRALVDGVSATKDLVSEPANVLYPEEFMNRCKELTKLGLEIEVLDKAMMQKLGMNSLLGVAQGSARDPYLVCLKWNGGSNEKPVAIVGKGVCFDTGGINIKTSASISDMKYDMAGAGVVFGLMKTLAGRKAKVNAVGVMGLVENMPSGTAQRPSDVVASMSGQTIEVDNTDAEGRLVLADALWYTQVTYDPKIIVDLATLTGAIVIALGDNGYAGLFSNDDELSAELSKAGQNTDEKVWRLPMSDFYDEQINSAIADVKNTGSGRGAGSITAAQFLKRFIQDGRKWAHLDIAGTAWNKSSSTLHSKGATAFGVRILDRWIRDSIEG